MYLTHLRALPAWLGHGHGHDIAVIFLPSGLQSRLGVELVGPIGCVFILANSLVAAPVSKRGRRVWGIVVDGKPRAETGSREGAWFASFLLSWLCQCVGREMPFVLWIGAAISVCRLLSHSQSPVTFQDWYCTVSASTSTDRPACR